MIGPRRGTLGEAMRVYMVLLAVGLLPLAVQQQSMQGQSIQRSVP